jgi:hypothetical protein
VCLTRVDFAVNAAGVGCGYKAIAKDNIVYDKGGSWRLSSFNKCWSKRWRKSGRYSNLEPNYILGFHIFLNKNDASRYGARYYGPGLYSVVKVEYKDVLAFGYNTTRKYRNGKCVIADRMRIVEIIK